MNTRQKIELLPKLYTTTKRGENDIYILSDNIDEETRDTMQTMQRALDVSFDLSYEIMAKACDIYAEAYANNEDSPTMLMEYIEENYRDYASVYTYERLSWLDNNNQSDITDIVIDHGCDIADACAKWYESKVYAVCWHLDEWINN